MGELRLYAVGIDEVRQMFGASDAEQQRLRDLAAAALAPPPVAAQAHGGLLTKLGPIFKRPPAALVVSPTQPVPRDLEVLLAGAYVAPERTGATWRLLETLVQGTAWESTLLALSPESLDELDFALVRGGVTSAVGLRHLLMNPLGVQLLPVRGLTVGWHRHEQALAMATAYRSALPQVESREQQEMLAALVRWLDDFVGLPARVSTSARPVPDLIGFWAN